MSAKTLILLLALMWTVIIFIIGCIFVDKVRADQLDNAVYICGVDEDCTQLWTYTPEVSI